MRYPHYDIKAPWRSDNQAPSDEVARCKSEALSAEIHQDLEACNEYAARHGSFAEMVREHEQRTNNDEPV